MQNELPTSAAAAEFFPTPGWCVERLLEVLRLPGGRWLEPCAGNGAIIEIADGPDIEWTAWELREEARPEILRFLPDHRIRIGDFLAHHKSVGDLVERFDVTITNPPFSRSAAFIETCLALSRTTVMLLPVSTLARAPLAANMPDVYVLPNRPSFDGTGTARDEYAWFVWGEEPRTAGRVQHLARTEPEATSYWRRRARQVFSTNP